MHPIEKKIITILKYGKKRKIEIVKILQTDKSDETIRRRIDDLFESGEISREGEDGPYYLPGEQREPVRPKQFADQERVSRLLYDMENRLGTVTFDFEEYHEDQRTIGRILSWMSTTDRGISDGEDVDIGNNILLAVMDFNSICSTKHYVLHNRQNLNSFLKIFDQVIEIFEDYDPDTSILMIPDEFFRLFFSSTNKIYRNWFEGKESEEFDKKMGQRAERLISTFDESQPKFHADLIRILTNISRAHGRDVFKSMVKSDNYDVEDLLEPAFYTYDVHNDIHKLFDDLTEVREEVDDPYKLDSLINEIIRMYTREIQDCV